MIYVVIGLNANSAAIVNDVLHKPQSASREIGSDKMHEDYGPVAFGGLAGGQLNLPGLGDYDVFPEQKGSSINFVNYMGTSNELAKVIGLSDKEDVLYLIVALDQYCGRGSVELSNWIKHYAR